MNDDCLFCKIVAKEIPSDVVAETASTLAFRDINPAAPTHVLVIPKAHIASADELGAEHADALVDVFATIQRVARDEGLDGHYRVVSNVGTRSGQSVFHVHFHLLGGRDMSWPPG